MVQSDPKAQFTLGIVPMKTSSYIKDTFLLLAGFLDPFILVLCYVAPIFRLVSIIVLEKEQNTREGMKMMGLKDSAYWLSLFAYYFIIFTIIALCLTAISNGLIYYYSNWFIIFLFYLVYGLSIFTFSLFMASFFSRARIASISSAMLYFVSYNLIILVQDPSISSTNKYLASLLPAIAGAFGSLTRVAYESGQYGIDFSNASNVVDNYAFSMSFIMLIVDFFIYLIIGLYLDNVIPSPTGARQPLTYFLSWEYWVGKGTEDINNTEKYNTESERNEMLNIQKDRFEDVGEELKTQEKNHECLMIRNLNKIFGDKSAVKNFSVNMYKGQIFALLGPNGAGKTTTISMLTGLLPASSGYATFSGFSIFEQMSLTREKLGVCPQHDVLFELLTPREHLEIFAAFKGRADNEQIQKDVEEILQDIELKDCEDMLSCNLSGGQRRKLSIGIAFIGNSAMIFLDEPTSGIDLAARKKVWVMLKKYKSAKVIILTTHYMEEAEELGDRIGIMASGTLKCVGSPLFLKTAYEEGYNLVVVIEDNMLPEEDRKVQEVITGFISKSFTESKMRRVAGREITYYLPKKESKQFKEFFARLDTERENLRIKSYGVTTNSLEDIFLQVAKEDSNEKGQAQLDEKQISDSHGQSGTPSELDHYSIAAEPEISPFQRFIEHFVAILLKRIYITIRGFVALISEVIVPILLILLGLVFTMIPTYFDGSTRWFYPNAYSTPQSILVNSNGINGVSADTFISLLMPGLTGTKVPVISSTDLGILLEMDNDIFSNSNVNPSRYGSIYLKSMNPTQHKYECVVFVNISSQDSSGAFVGMLSQTILQIATNNTNLAVTFANSPLPLTYECLSREQANEGSIVSQTLVVAFSLVPASVICFVVREREDNLKHQQIISGVSLLAYWTANSAIDIFKSLVPCSVGIGLVYAFNIMIPDAWVLIIVYAFSIIPFTYVTSFLFYRENVAQIATLMLHFLLGVVLSPIFTMLHLFSSTKQAGYILSWIFRIIPSFSLAYGINNISKYI